MDSVTLRTLRTHTGMRCAVVSRTSGIILLSVVALHTQSIRVGPGGQGRQTGGHREAFAAGEAIARRVKDRFLLGVYFPHSHPYLQP